MVWWVRSDPCGLFSAFLTLFLLIYAELVVVFVILLPWYGLTYHILAYTTLVILATISHTQAQFSDPGAIPKTFLPLPPPSETETESETSTSASNGSSSEGASVTPPSVSIREHLTIKLCKKCRTVKPPGVHHCSTCARCIMRMDHHCPWVNNCVAIFNQKYFILFLFYTATACIYTGVLLVCRFVSCTRNLRGCDIGGAGVALSVLVFVEALVFGLFTIIMVCDQFSAVLDNTPAIDALQNKKGEPKPRMQAIIDVFGERFGWRWFCPFRVSKKLQQDFERELQLSEDNQRLLYKEKELLRRERSRLQQQETNENHQL